MNTRARCYALCLWLSSFAWGQGASQPASQPANVILENDRLSRVIEFSIPGSAENTSSHAIVVLPPEYFTTQLSAPPGSPDSPPDHRHWPVVYLLHGYSGNYTNWYEHTRKTNRLLWQMAQRYGVILVLPDGKFSSWYLNAVAEMPDAADWQWETVMTKYLVPQIDREYRTWAEPAGRGITGLSMGGHGALYLAARHPELFGACGTMSGITDLTTCLHKYDLARRLGPLEDFHDRWVQESVMSQCEKFVGRTTGILLDCGWSDPFAEQNRMLHAKLVSLKVPHDYVERPGAHTWDYWVNALPYHLQFLADHLRPAGETLSSSIRESSESSPPVASQPATAESARSARAVSFRPVFVAQKLPDDPYGLDIADMNGDGRPDIVLIRFTTVVWYENPSWTVHTIVTDGTHQNVSGGVYDVDGDGHPDLAVACDWKFTDTRTDGNIWWAKATAGQDPWPLFHLNEKPNIHRIRWVDVDGDGKKELLVAPLKGILTEPPDFSQFGIELYLMRIPPLPETDHWMREMIDRDLHMCHGVVGVQFDLDPPQEILTASAEGVHLFKRTPTGPWNKTRLCEGEQTTSPFRGSSEVALGRLNSGRRMIATIEPFHGNEVVVYLEPRSEEGLWPRYLLDNTFDEGHGIACVDLNGDGNTEIVAGYRGPNHDGRPPTSLMAYYPIEPEKRWHRQVIDEGGMATEDLKVADMNGDGRLDIISCGRATRNLKIYFNRGLNPN